MLIRNMAPADLEAVAEIEQQSPSPWTADLIVWELSFPGSIVLVREDGKGRVLGWCCARIAGGEAELLKIAVHPGRRGAGNGDALLFHLENRLKARGVEALFLEVRSRNLPALGLYRKHGFAQVGERSGYYSNPIDDAVVLKKVIDIGN